MLHECLDFGEIRRVPSHVGSKDYSYESLAEGLVIVTREVLKEVVLRFVENGKGLSCMEVFLDRHI